MTLEEQLDAALKVNARVYREMKILPRHAYSGSAEFVSKHGRFYRGAWPGFYQQGAARQCYGTAIMHGAMWGLKYIEGFALSPFGDVIPHAWNADAEGRLIDATWMNTGLAYKGVEFSLERADDATWNGDACVLDDKRDGFAFFRQPWTGEDYGLTWPYSERLDVLRDPDHESVKRRGMEMLDRVMPEVEQSESWRKRHR